MSFTTGAIKNVLERRALFQDGSARVADVACGAHRSDFCDEEGVECAQFIVPRRGIFAMQIRGSSTVVDAATAIVLSAGTKYRVAHPEDGGDDCTTITTGLDAPQAFLKMDVAFRKAVARLRQALDPLEAHERSFWLFDRARSARRLGSIEARDREPLEHARYLLASDYNQPLSLSKIAKAVHLSAYHLARRFRAYTGTSMHQYRMQVRLNQAFTRVTESDDELGRIGIDVGFSSASHFSQQFKAIYGETPSEARSRR